MCEEALGNTGKHETETVLRLKGASILVVKLKHAHN